MRPQDNDIHQNPATIHLSVVYQNDPWSASFMNSMRFILSAIPITSLDIGLHKMPLSLFIKVICSLPNLLELKVHELSFDQRDSLSIEEKEDLDNYSISNKVTSVSHSAERHLTPFLMNLCPRMECFEMFCKSSEIPEAYVRYILTKTITDVPKLHLLKLWIYKANDQTILKLQHLIDSEKLLDNYIIKRWEYYLILKWKLNEKDEFCFRF
jgi:hypothetical protein